MTEPLWRRGASVAAALAGLSPEEASIGLTAHDAAGIRRGLRALRGRDRMTTADRIAREAMRIAWAPNPMKRRTDARDAESGARLLNAVLRVLPRPERESLARAFPGDVLRAVARAGAVDVTVSLARGFSILIASLRSIPDVAMLGQVARAANGDDTACQARVHTALRAVRVRGLDPERVFGSFAEEMP